MMYSTKWTVCIYLINPWWQFIFYLIRIQNLLIFSLLFDFCFNFFVLLTFSFSWFNLNLRTFRNWMDWWMNPWLIFSMGFFLVLLPVLLALQFPYWRDFLLIFSSCFPFLVSISQFWLFSFSSKQIKLDEYDNFKIKTKTKTKTK